MDEGFPGPSMRPASHKERAPINNIWSNVRMLRTMISTELVVLQLMVELPPRSGVCGQIMSDLERHVPGMARSTSNHYTHAVPRIGA
ncbi:hypothetical protein MCOR02_005938 [Pyricularia oryzae]|uniref:Uncharacterized protein n=1 Tax=Pyricularia oryzae TaxID=318829 RepID=A0A4P7NKK6_PYROR|nr:hypothetical protein MCOR02_005938 [Pyricularia oryzae]KAI6337730.1 hypothetical protein MCOR30_003317 [Pyricularia oryzae]KAI6345122.1 hypothetical protein MCOR28_003746 [Pyricularia oryzae]KAI6394734.1 hypothetical protein MCOR23_007368 [Pyricularia oryzae]KAI6429741.1 hypothetical protein MCOR21_004891 [Pyricularia oryzae]